MYKFKKLDNNDEFMLMYGKDKSIKFKRTIKTAQRLQSIDSEARFKVFQELSAQGYTVDNNPFIVEKKEGSKTIRDESNFNYIIEQTKNDLVQKITMEIIGDMFNMDFEKLVQEVGLEEKSMAEVEKFFYELAYIIKTGEIYAAKKTPSTNN